MVHVSHVMVPSVPFQFAVPGIESPVQLAELSGDVSGLFKQFRQEHFFCGRLDCGGAGRFFLQFLMGPSLFFRGHHQAAGCLRIGMGMTVMDSHQQRGARRAAILAAVATGKHDALFGQTVDVRRFDNLLAVTAQHAHAQVIRVAAAASKRTRKRDFTKGSTMGRQGCFQKKPPGKYFPGGWKVA